MVSVGVLARFEFTVEAAPAAEEFFENGRLGGPRAARAGADLFAAPPSFEKVEIVAARPAD